MFSKILAILIAVIGFLYIMGLQKDDEDEK